jgi:hypothetical protein
MAIEKLPTLCQVDQIIKKISTILAKEQKQKETPSYATYLLLKKLFKKIFGCVIYKIENCQFDKILIEGEIKLFKRGATFESDVFADIIYFTFYVNGTAEIQPGEANLDKKECVMGTWHEVLKVIVENYRQNKKIQLRKKQKQV